MREALSAGYDIVLEVCGSQCFLTGYCPNGHAVRVTAPHFRQGRRCADCGWRARAQAEAQSANDEGYRVKAVTRQGRSGTSLLVGTCPAGHAFKTTPSRFRGGVRCAVCHRGSTNKKYETYAAASGFPDLRCTRGNKSSLWLTGTCPNGHPMRVPARERAGALTCPTCRPVPSSRAASRTYFWLDALRAERYAVSLQRTDGDYFLVGCCPSGHPVRLRSDVVAQGSRCKECLYAVRRDAIVAAARAEGYVGTWEMRSGTNQALPWLVGGCPNGHSVAMRLPAFAQGRRCRRCARSGFDSAKPSWFYVIHTSPGVDAAVQFGITNKYEDRLRKHARAGFVDVLLLLADDGRTVQLLELHVKRALRAKGFPTCRDQGAFFDGATESFYLTDCSIEQFHGILVKVQAAQAEVRPSLGAPELFDAVHSYAGGAHSGALPVR